MGSPSFANAGVGGKGLGGRMAGGGVSIIQHIHIASLTVRDDRDADRLADKIAHRTQLKGGFREMYKVGP